MPRNRNRCFLWQIHTGRSKTVQCKITCPKTIRSRLPRSGLELRHSRNSLSFNIFYAHAISIKNLQHKVSHSFLIISRWHFYHTSSPRKEFSFEIILFTRLLDPWQKVKIWNDIFLYLSPPQFLWWVWLVRYLNVVSSSALGFDK